MEQITAARDMREFCHDDVPKDAILSQYCGCEGTTFRGQHFSNMTLSGFKLTDSDFFNVTFTNVTFSDLYLENCNFTTCVLENVTFESRCAFKLVNWNQTVFSGVNVSGLSVCNGSTSEVVEEENAESGDGGIVRVELVTVLEGVNGSCEDVEVKCEEKKRNKNIYRDLFFVSGAAFPGNIASAIAVYFLRRNYWLGSEQIYTTQTNAAICFLVSLLVCSEYQSLLPLFSLSVFSSLQHSACLHQQPLSLVCTWSTLRCM